MPTSPYYKPAAKPTEHPQKRPIFSAWSAADTAKEKAIELSDAAQKEYEKASTAAQAKVGGIELYSGKYYAACTVGGILACVRLHIRRLHCTQTPFANPNAGYHPRCCDSPRFGQMPSPGRCKALQEQLPSVVDDCKD